jgi:hypothetical protein
MRDRERGTRPSSQDQSSPDLVLDSLLAGRPLPGEDQAGLQPVADVLAALRAPAAPAELTGQASALAAFRAQPHRSRSHRKPRRGQSPQRGRPVLGALLRPRPVTALAAGVVVAALAAGAYEGDLPAPVQQWAHHTFGLTASRSREPLKPGHHGSSPTASSSATASHRHQHSTAQPTVPEHGTQQDQPRADSHRSTGRDGHQHNDQPGGPGPSSGGPSGSPSPSDHNSPQPSTSPAAQPSPQPSSSSSSHQPHSSPSSSP